MEQESKAAVNPAAQTAGLSLAEKRALAERLLQKKASAASTAFAQSYSQAAMWFLHQLDPQSAAYHVAFTARICSAVDVPALERALQRLVDRHPALRTTFTKGDSAKGEQRPLQVVAGHRRAELHRVDAADWTEAELYAAVMAAYAEPFDLENGPVLRVALFERPADQVLLIVAHHIVMDGWSAGLFLNELLAVYAAETGSETGGETAVLPVLEARYADYAAWQQQLLGGPEGERLGAYWRQALAGELPVLSLPLDYARPQVQSHAGATTVLTIDAKLTEKLRKLARSEGVTLYMLLLTGFYLLLSFWAEQEEVLIGSPMAGRSQGAWANIIGDFVNMVVIRVRGDRRQSVRHLLAQVRGQVLAALEHQEYPFALLVERLGGGLRDASRSPIFQVSFDLQRLGRFGPLAPLFLPYNPQAQISVAGLVLEPYFIPQQEGQFDLSLQLAEAENQIVGALKYNTALFQQATISQIQRAYLYLLEKIVISLDAPFVELRDSIEAMHTNAFLAHLRQLDIKLWVEGERLRVNAPAGRIGPDLQKEIARRKEEIIAVLKRSAAGAALDLKPVPRQGPMPLSFSQQRLWFLDQMNPGSAAYNIVIVSEMIGSLNVEVLRRSLNEIVRRHEVLRTRFVATDGQAGQVADPFSPLEIPLVDLRHLPPAEAVQEARRLASQDGSIPFDLSHSPLFRAVVFQLTADRYILVATCHHIAFDGWSIGVMTREIAALYTAFAEGKPSPLPPLPLQFADFAWWQRQSAQGERTERELAYWTRKLAGPLPILDLPTDFPRPAFASTRGRRRSFCMSRQLIDDLHELSSREGVTLYITLLAAFNTLLYRYTRQEDIIVGSPVAGREQSETEGLVGLFVNNLVLRSDLSGAPTFRQLLQRVRQVTLEAFDYQHVPFDRLVEALHPDRDPSRFPFFQVFFSLQNVPLEDLKLTGVTIRRLEIDLDTSRFDLTLELWERPDGMLVEVEFCTDLFEEATIGRMVDHYETLLHAIVRDVDQPLADLPLLPAEERRTLLEEWNDTAAAYPRHLPVHRLFETQAAARPDACAVACSGDRIRYADLNRRANQLARHLQTLGVGPDKLVGIYMDRSIDMIVALLAVHKAGGAYLPLDPMFPSDRLAFMLEDSGAACVISQTHLADAMPPHTAQVVWIDRDWPQVAVQADENLPDLPGGAAYHPERLAYVLYTSGSTGRPKGVQVPQGALVNFLLSMQQTPGMTAEDILLSVTTLSFDIAGLEIFLPLITGAQVEMAPYAVAADGAALLALLQSCGATVMQATPATWRLLMSAGWEGTPRLKVLCGGEAMPGELANQLLGRCASLWNMYGPTETTIWSTVYRVEKGEGIMPIGRPIANTAVYILDEARQPVPIGVAGELYIGGDGLAVGYLNRPELTAEKFVSDPFAGGDARMYRTGDLARYRADGNLEFLGRIDFQVKIRGFRIELGEIEAVLDEHPAIRQAVVVAREDRPGDRRLVAYLALAGDTAPSAADLRSYLKGKLPDYMVPAVFVMVDAFPLTPNGKVNRKALPAPTEARVEVSAHQVAPRSETERRIAAIWQAVLGVEKVGVTDNFFDLGGHSLLIIQVHNQLRQSFGANLTVAQMFQYPTIEALAAHLQQPQAAPANLQQAQDRAARQRAQLERLAPKASSR